MSDQSSTPEAQEAKHANALPKQIRDQMAELDALLTQGDDQGGQEDDQNDGQNDGQDDGQPEDDQPQETWEQRARSTLGRLEQAVQTNQQLARRVSELEQQIGTVKLRANGSPPPTQESYAKPVLIKPEERDDYGEEFFDVVGRRAKEEFAPEFEMLAARLKRLETGQSAISQVVEKTQQRTLYDQLTDEVPDWRAINKHPAFLSWLQIPDPYSGMPRSELLSNAFSRQDTHRVINFFKGFLTEAVGPPSNTPSPGYSAPPLPSNGNASGRPSLEDFAAPGRARSGQHEASPGKPTYTEAWIAQFSADKRSGRYRGREADAEAIERDIYQAQHEGRIF